MKVHYLEIVTTTVEAVCTAYAKALGATFGGPVPELGGARTVPMDGGGMVGVRAPLRDDEAPVVRPYWLVNDIDAAVTAIVEAGGTVAVPPMAIPGRGTFAIYLQAGNDHGLWQV
jgi:predicted enzyme related to lactoylglutathione lyase